MRDVHIVDRAKINIERNNRVTGFDRYSFKVFIFLCGTVNNEVVKAAGGSLGDFAVLKCKSDLVFAEKKKYLHSENQGRCRDNSDDIRHFHTQNLIQKCR